MIRFQIPKPFIPGFQSLLSLDNEELTEIIEFLRKVPVGIGPKTFRDTFQDQFRGKEKFNPNLAGTLYSLGGFFVSINNEKISNEELVSSLTNSIKDQIDNKLNEKELSQLQSYLREIFNASEQLSATFKAFQLLAENERVIRDAHIITDVRLLFKPEIKKADRYALLKHQLKLQVEEDGEQTDYYFSLSNTDLQKMLKQIERAIQKEELIRSDYEDTISFITITE